ncbi:MAG: hypothetical protein ACTSPQ_20060 [Candidatus Helarchaeota archaeon]
MKEYSNPGTFISKVFSDNMIFIVKFKVPEVVERFTFIKLARLTTR